MSIVSTKESKSWNFLLATAWPNAGHAVTAASSQLSAQAFVDPERPRLKQLMSVTLAIMLSAILSGGSSNGRALKQAYRLGEWQFRAQRDSFTGAVRCQLFRGAARAWNLAYARRSLAFRFNAHLNTLDAAFKVDDGPATTWGAVYPTLVQLGAAPTAGTMDNPTGGLVILPVSVLAGAHHVTIRPTPRSKPQTFDVLGWSDARARARALGCPADADFNR